MGRVLDTIGQQPKQQVTYASGKVSGGTATPMITGGEGENKKTLFDVLTQVANIAAVAAPMMKGNANQANTGTGRDGKFGKGTYGRGMPSGKDLKAGMGRQPSGNYKHEAKPKPETSVPKRQTGGVNAKKLAINTKAPDATGGGHKPPTRDGITTTQPNTSIFAQKNWSALSTVFGKAADALSGGETNYSAFSNLTDMLATLGKKENESTLKIEKEKRVNRILGGS